MEDVKRSHGWRAWFGSRCVLSGMRPAIDGLHPAWRERLPRLAACCPVCAQPQEHVLVCGRCHQKPPAFRSTFAAWAYDTPIDSLIMRFKFSGDLPVSRALASAFTACPPPQSDGAVLVPMPSHTRRLRERGFDHIGMLAGDIGKRLNLPLAPAVLKRARHTPPQTGLTARQRELNLSAAFEVRNAVPERVILFDDVVTTGATIRAAAKALLRAGCKQIVVWALARA